jgi:dTDP-4-dehydrorhamnose reductase
MSQKKWREARPRLRPGLFHMFLIVGGDSEIGGAAFAALRARGHAAEATTRRPGPAAHDRLFLDLATSLEGWQPPEGATCACVCAAVARLADCAADPEGSAQVNVTQTLALADLLHGRGIYVLILSTNHVFDGRVAQVPAGAPHSPVSEYGKQKARTEAALLEKMADGAPIGILRLAKVVSPHTPLLQSWVADLAQARPISAFSDMRLAPANLATVCEAIRSLLSERARGVFQLTGPRDVSYAETGGFLAGKLGVSSSLVRATSARSAGLPEGGTPLHTTLDSTALRDRFGLEVPDVWEVIEGVMSSEIDQRRALQNAR